MHSLFKKATIIMMLSIVTVTIWSFFGMPEAKASNLLTGKEHLLYGFNVTAGKEMVEPDSFQTAYPIIDPNSDYLDYVKKDSTNTKQESHSIRTSTMKKMVTEYASTFGLGAGTGVSAGTYGFSLNVNSLFNRSTSFTNIYSEYYELYYTSIRRYSYFVHDLTTSEIREYLSPRFKSDMASISSLGDAKNVIQRYGTHLFTGLSFGGRLNVSNYKVSTDENVKLSETMSLDEQMGLAIKAVTADQSFSFSEEFGNEINTRTTESKYKFVSYGGKGTSSLTIDDLFTYNPAYVDGNNAGFMYTRWINSINDGDENELAIIDLPSNASAIPLWNLLDNKSSNAKIRSYLIDAYKELAGDRYEEFNAKYQELSRNFTNTETGGYAPDIDSVYVMSKNGYVQYVDGNDFSTSGAYNAIHNGDVLYLGLSNFNNPEKVNFKVVGGKEVGNKNGIFQVDDSNLSSDTFKVIAEYVVNGEDYSTTLISLPIKNNVFESGVGSEAYPYLITSPEQFYKIDDYNSSNFVLANDLNFKGVSKSPLSSFSGVLDGKGHKLINYQLDLTTSLENPNGIFSINKGTIKNLVVEKSGTSTDESNFTDGAIFSEKDYKEVTNSSGLKKNSAHSFNIGVLCGINEGTIENCLITEGFIRNLCWQDVPNFTGTFEYDERKTNVKIVTMSAGLVCGKNTGTINGVKVTKSRILNTYYNTENSETAYINVYTGGITGLLTGKNGTIKNCVVDSPSDSKTTINSFLTKVFKDTSSDKNGECYCYVGGLIGFCKNEITNYEVVGTLTIKNNYVYEAGNYSIDAFFNIEGNKTPVYWYVIRSVAFPYLGNYRIIDEKGSWDENVINTRIESSDNYYYSVTEDNVGSSKYQGDAIINYDKDYFRYYDKKTWGGNILNITEKNYEESKFNSTHWKNAGLFSKKTIDSSSALNNSNISSTYYEYESGNTTSAHIKHKLENVNQISIRIDNSDQIKNKFYDQGYFVFEPNTGVVVNAYDSSTETKTKLDFFKLTLKKNDQEVSVTDRLEVNNDYKVYVSYDNATPVSTNLNVSNKKLVSIVVDESNVDDYTIYYDEIDEYINAFDNNEILGKSEKFSLKLKAIYNNNEEEVIDANNTIIKNAKVKILTNDICQGSNQIIISYGTTSELFKDIKYVLYVEKRDIDSITVTNAPSKTSYIVGETIDLSGLELEVNYNEGDNASKKITDVSRVEVIGDLSEGINSLYLVADMDYSNMVSIDLTARLINVVFKNYDDTIIQEYKLEKGDTPIAPTPTREKDDTYQYFFNGWDKPVVQATEDVEYKAVYTAVEIKVLEETYFTDKVDELATITDYKKLYKEIKEAYKRYETADKSNQNVIAHKKTLDELKNSFDGFVDSANKDNSDALRTTSSIFTGITYTKIVGAAWAFVEFITGGNA